MQALLDAVSLDLECKEAVELSSHALMVQRTREAAARAEATAKRLHTLHREVTRGMIDREGLAELGDAACRMARWLSSGGSPLVDHDEAQAQRLFAIAASFGNLTARSGLGMSIFRRGGDFGVIGLVQVAMAAGAGSEAARLSLASLFETGSGIVKKNEAISLCLCKSSKRARLQDSGHVAREAASRKLKRYYH